MTITNQLNPLFLRREKSECKIQIRKKLNLQACFQSVDFRTNIQNPLYLVIKKNVFVIACRSANDLLTLSFLQVPVLPGLSIPS